MHYLINIKSKQALMLLILISFLVPLSGQQVGINTATPDESATLDISSTNKGLLIPRMTNMQRDMIPSPATGLLVFQTDGDAGFYYFDNNSWEKLEDSGSGQGGVNGSGSYEPSLKATSLGQGKQFSYHYNCVQMENGELKCWGYNGYFVQGIGNINTVRYDPITVPYIDQVETFVMDDANVYTILENGQLWASGYNAHGQVGDGTTTYAYTPKRVGTLSNVVKVVGSRGGTSAIPSTACAILADGTLWCWGYNGYGQVGDGTTTNKTTPVQVGIFNDIIDVDIAGGQYASVCALRADSTVWCWGYNGYGQLGDGTTISRSAPAKIAGLSGVTKIYSTTENSTPISRYAVKADGTVWAWGYNGYGQLGNNTTTTSYTPVQVQGINNAVDIVAAGGRYCFAIALLSDNTVRTWGYNGFGQLGNGNTIAQSTPVDPMVSNVASIHAGGSATGGMTALVLADSTVMVMGYNGFGQLGVGSVTSSSTPQPVVGLSDVVSLKLKGTGNYVLPCALLANGRMVCWGYNGNGQCGTGNVVNSYVPQRVKNIHE